MITDSLLWNLIGGCLLALIAALAMAEVKSSSLVPRSLLLWPPLVILFGILNVVQGWIFLGIVLILCGIQAGGVNLRRLAPWPSGGVWLGLAGAGIAFQWEPLAMERVIGFVWVAIGITKVVRERSASLESGVPLWISLLFVQAILLASYR